MVRILKDFSMKFCLVIIHFVCLNILHAFGLLRNIQAKRSTRQQADGRRMGRLLGVFGQGGRSSGFPAEDEGVLLEEGTATSHHRCCLVRHPTRCRGFDHCQLVFVRISDFLSEHSKLFKFCHLMLFLYFGLFWLLGNTGFHFHLIIWFMSCQMELTSFVYLAHVLSLPKCLRLAWHLYNEYSYLVEIQNNS